MPLDPDFDQEVWEAMVREHQQRHLEEISRGLRSRRPKRP
ncbi:hypothetical protein MicB006_1586 [Micromonospora sp. B006]|nr:hypothetical protein MicB006_1586 [Micromonospora sp. B006]